MNSRRVQYLNHRRRRQPVNCNGQFTARCRGTAVVIAHGPDALTAGESSLLPLITLDLLS